jgi:hypothetical protein
MEARNRFVVVLVGVTAAAVLASCDDGSVPSAATNTGPPASPAAAPDPAIREAVTAAPSFDVGHTVHVTSAGIQPRSLVSLCCAPVIFKNETGADISIVFWIGKIDSGPIAPGASWAWTPPNPESVGYHLGAGPSWAGQLQIESPDW